MLLLRSNARDFTFHGRQLLVRSLQRRGELDSVRPVHFRQFSLQVKRFGGIGGDHIDQMSTIRRLVLLD